MASESRLGGTKVKGARISCHTANAESEERVLKVRRNDNEIKRNAAPLYRGLRSHQF